MKTIDARARIQLRNILFTTDFSAAAHAAVPYAADLARHFGARLYVVNVRPMAIGPLMVPGGDHGAVEAARIDAEQRTKQILTEFPDSSPHVLIEEGDVWSNLEDTINSSDIDMIVTGTRGRSGIAKLLLGSVAEEILRKAACPVLTVGPHVHGTAAPEADIHTVLLAADFNPQSRAASYAVSLAQEYQARLVLLHVTPPGEVADSSRSAEMLRYFVPLDAELWCKPEYIVEPGDVAGTILRVAGQRQADLIVMGARKSSGFPGASTHLSTTAHRVVVQAPCPVLTVQA